MAQNMANETIKHTLSKVSLPSFDILGAHQYRKNCQRANPAEAEKALIFSVLAEAVDTFQRFAFCESSRGQSFFREVEDWFWSEKSDSVFSFLRICEVFGLDPGFLRRGLLQWTARRQWRTSPRKKIQLHMETSRARRVFKNGGKKSASKHGTAAENTTALKLVSPSD